MINRLHTNMNHQTLSIAGACWQSEFLPLNVDDYKLFLTCRESVQGNGLRIKEAEAMHYSDLPNDRGQGYVWTRNGEGRLLITVTDSRKKLVYGSMVLDEDLQGADVLVNRQLFNIRYDVTDFMMFLFFQIRLLFVPGIVLHASAVEWNGQAIVFSAPSETGKSTQAKLWEQVMGARMINGDRPPLTVHEGKVLVHGSPWTGSDPVIRNVSVPAAAIVLLEQSTDNSIRLLSANEALLHLMPRCFMPYFEEKLMDLAMQCIHSIVSCTPVFLLKCRPEEAALHLVKDQLSLLKG